MHILAPVSLIDAAGGPWRLLENLRSASSSQTCCLKILKDYHEAKVIQNLVEQYW